MLERGSWDQWKNFLGDKLDQAQDAGMKQSTINDLAHQLGDYLSENVDPKNDQERVLSDLWSVANENEQQSLANVMMKLVQNNLK